MKWFTSDFHFGHANIAGPKVSKWPRGYRDFSSIKEMDQAIIKTINKYVAFDDDLYFLGDWCFGGHEKTPQYRTQIFCRNLFTCRGNHDKHIDRYNSFFSSIEDTQRIMEKGIPPIFMSHYSHRVWEGSHKGYIHLYGHSHGNIPDHGKSMDVGIDVAYRMFGEYRPFSLTEIVEIMSKKEVVLLDHHDKHTDA